MPTPALLLLIAVLLPLVSFVVLVFLGKKMGNPLAGYIGTLFIAGSLACSAAATFSWLSGGKHGGAEWGFGKAPINLPYQWIPVGQGLSQTHAGFLDVGIYVDSLTVVMFFMITGVATLVHIFSIGYMSEDKRFPRFFTYLGLFCFSMLGLVIGGTALHLFIFWELVGLCSYLLIGFWYEKKSASNAAIKAFVTNRVGDFGFLIGFGILFYHLGNVSLPSMWGLLHAAGTGAAITLPNGTVFGSGLLTIMGIGLFFGAMGKSAQFPLHVWLPDAMEGPTPVSALIHAATMVAAGVYLCGRIFPVLTPDAKLFIAIIGCTTLTMAALIAIAQSDIKKVLAYSTLSQLGYMILAIGVGSWVGALFHLITHAFFKALLFLGSGSVIHAAHHEQELPQYGGLLRKIPVTALTFLVAVFAIAGFGITFSKDFTFAFSGFYSKDLILQHAAAFGFLSDHSKTGAHNYLWLLFWCPAIIAYVTPFYMMRCWTLTFWGKPRNQHLYDHAHESPILYIPLVLLAVAAIIGGKYLGVREMIETAQVEMNKIVQAEGQPPTDLFATAWPAPKPEGVTPATPGEAHSEAVAEEPGATHGKGPLASGGSLGGKTGVDKTDLPHHPADAKEMLEQGEEQMHHALAGGWAWLIALGLGFLMYMNGYGIANAIMKIPPMRWIHTWLYRRMYFDELYKFVFVGTVMFLSYLAAAFDRLIVDGAVNFVAYLGRQTAFLMGANDKYVVDGAVNGAGAVAQSIGRAVRSPQTGRVRLYVTVLMCVIAVSIAGAIVVVLSR